MNIDLHTHSNCSDGALSPADLVARAAAAGVEVLALTDHDTLEGIEEAQQAARLLSVKLVPGVEISASWRAQAIHVLGLWVDPASAALRALLAAQTERRHLRMRTICAKLTKLGLPGDALLAAVQLQRGVPTRAHLAEAMLAGGHVTRVDEAFRKFLGAGKPAHFAAQWPPLAEVVRCIGEAGGTACLAHPARYSLSAGARRHLLGDFAAANGGALEVITGANGAQHVEASTELAVKFGFSGSVGSDFHSPQHTWNPLGRLPPLPERVAPIWRGRAL